MSDKYSLGMRGKAVLGLTTLLLLSLSITTYSSYLKSTQVAERKVIELEQNKLSLLKHDIEGSLKGHENILRSLQGVPPVQGVLRTRSKDASYLEYGSSLQDWKSQT